MDTMLKDRNSIEYEHLVKEKGKEECERRRKFLNYTDDDWIPHVTTFALIYSEVYSFKNYLKRHLI